MKVWVEHYAWLFNVELNGQATSSLRSLQLLALLPVVDLKEPEDRGMGCRVIQCMYPNAQSHVWVNGQYSEEFGMGVGVHQISDLSLLLFILVLETLVCHGSFFMLMNWCSSWTPRRSISLSSRHGRLVWKAKGPLSTLRRPSYWSLVMAIMSSRHVANTLLLSALAVLATTPSNAHSIWFGPPEVQLNHQAICC